MDEEETLVHSLETKRYWVAFSNGNDRYPWLKSGFRHINIITERNGILVIFVPMGGVLDFALLGVDSDTKGKRVVKKTTTKKVKKPSNADYIAAIANQKNTRVLEVDIYQGVTKNPCISFVLRTCVSLTKYILGIECWAYTPYCLYRKLLTDKRYVKCRRLV